MRTIAPPSAISATIASAIHSGATCDTASKDVPPAPTVAAGVMLYTGITSFLRYQAALRRSAVLANAHA